MSSATEQLNRPAPELLDASDKYGRLAEQVQSGVMALRLENESIQTMAMVKPRDMVKIKGELVSLLQAFPALADECVYSKPVGRQWDKERREMGPMKFAENLSVRAAELFRGLYGCTRLRTSAVPAQDTNGHKGAMIGAVFTDFQTGNIEDKSYFLPQRFTNYKKEVTEHPDDRFWGLVVKAESSKAVREAVMQAINPALKQWFRLECEKIIASTLTPDRINEIVDYFIERKMPIEAVEVLVGKPRFIVIGQDQKSNWTRDDMKKARGLKAGLEQGEFTVEDLINEAAGAIDQDRGDKSRGEESQESPEDRASRSEGIAKELEEKRKAEALRIEMEQIRRQADDPRCPPSLRAHYRAMIADLESIPGADAGGRQGNGGGKAPANQSSGAQGDQGTLDASTRSQKKTRSKAAKGGGKPAPSESAQMTQAPPDTAKADDTSQVADGGEAHSDQYKEILEHLATLGPGDDEYFKALLEQDIPGALSANGITAPEADELKRRVVAEWAARGQKKADAPPPLPTRKSDGGPGTLV